MKANYSQDICTEGIAFYLDGTGFAYTEIHHIRLEHQKLVSGEKNLRVWLRDA